MGDKMEKPVNLLDILDMFGEDKVEVIDAPGFSGQVRVKSNITVTNPPESLLDWCEDKLVLPNPDYEKKLRMGFWTGNTPKTLALYETHGSSVILPYGVLDAIKPFVQGTHDIRSGFAQWPTIDYGGMGIDLYPYQEKAVQALLNAKYGILQSPAGSGKTQMGIELIKRFRLPALWLTHTKDLLGQSKARAARYMDEKLIGTITEGKVNIGRGVTFATVQTMSKLDLGRYADMWPVVIVDECHHAAGTPTMVTRFSRVLNHLNAPYKYGLSATVHRADGLIQCVYALLGPIVHTVPAEEISGRIMKVSVVPVGTGAVMTDDCLKPDGTLDYAGMINVLCIDTDRNRLIAETLKRHRERPSIILSERLDHLGDLIELLPEDMAERACLVSGKTKKDVRERAIEDMRTGRKDYLFATYALSREGLDIPRLESLYLTTPVKDEAVVIQAIGRIARTSPDKKTPTAFDFIDAIPFCKRAWKERCRHYKQIGAQLCDDTE